MGRQKHKCQGKGIVDSPKETKHFKSWTDYDGKPAYEIDSQQPFSDRMERTGCVSAHNGALARRCYGLTTGSRKPEAQNPSLSTSQLSRTLADDTSYQKMLIPSCPHFLEESMRLALKSAGRNPPVTTNTLVELDLNLILHNIHLRSDINFDDDLHFMPVRGERAEKKQKEAQSYWLALAAELQIHLHTHLPCVLPRRDEEDDGQESFTPRLPQMFGDLRELLETLVPDRDHASIAGNLDVPFLMQQIENGVLDICQLARWLATLLKSHCAPMRDGWADEMTQQVEEGSRTSNMILLVEGIERLFSVLEAMKLVMLPTASPQGSSDQPQDVANHQIRTFRYHLMEDTISFQQKFFAKRVMDGKIDATSCRNWYQKARRLRSPCVLNAPSSVLNIDGYPNIIQGIVAALFGMQSDCALPESFQLDLKRLEQIGSDTQDLVNLRMAVLVFDELRSWLTSGRAKPVPLEMSVQLQSRILAIVDEQVNHMDPWQTGSADVALEITRAAYTICGCDQVVIPDTVIQSAHVRLDDLRSGRAHGCGLIIDMLHESLTTKAIHHAQIFSDKTPLEILEVQQQWRQQRARSTNVHSRAPDIEDIARRVAHVGIIHWKIWANLVYLEEGGESSGDVLSLIKPSSDPCTRECTRVGSAPPSSLEMAVE